MNYFKCEMLYRLGCFKGTYGKQENAWDCWTPEMQTYCEQDVEVLEKLYRQILKQAYSPEALALEREFQQVIHRQEQVGVPFNVPAANVLYAELAGKREVLKQQLDEVFPPKRIEEIFVPKVNNRTRGYVKGVPFTKVRYETFIAAPLLHLCGLEGGGVHFMGNSSIGKSVLLLVAGSVAGGGSNGFLRRWRATDNALESVALEHNDALLCLDEIGQVASRVAAETSYMLANGQGKAGDEHHIQQRRIPPGIGGDGGIYDLPGRL